MDNGKGGGWKKERRKRLMLYENDIAIVKDDDCYRYIEIKLETKCVWGDEGPKLKGNNAQGSRS